MPSAREQLREAMSFGSEERDALYAALVERKTSAYLAGAGELADRYGQDEVVLSHRITDAIEEASMREANAMVASYNADLDRAIVDALDASESIAEVLLRLEEWAHQRAERHAPVVGVTSVYDAYTDAQIAFFRNAGVEPEFDFGGHGDEPPACPICAELVATNPHPLSRVIEIGTPHPQCRQQWHPRDFPPLPADYRAGGGGPAGIVGKVSLVQRAGGRQQAVEAIRGMS